ncbi:thioredoxin domain-containing protein [Novosphingobium flavum]|uniref:Thioredoxin domain-containing protein n=1 Tax=Novosphingobium flavum TaxID=1778672 RepID=A0A7X1KLQ7_9SPHN|nr:thioredoxin domain-containing protein [Novosphingobium flavum]MBC2665832.1 thioredoxin domain-containing protein [Novosphingobium flavum]
MTRTLLVRLTATALIAPLVLGLAACKKDAASEGAAAPSGPVTAAAPPAGKAWKDVVASTGDGGYLMGNPNAPVKLVEYGSLSCPHCAKLAQEGFPTLVDNYVASGKVSLEFRSFAIHPQDVPLTVLAECGGTDTFFPLAEELYKNYDEVTERTMKGADAANKLGTLPDNQRFVTLSEVLGFTDFFAARGLSKDQQKACLSDFAKASAVAKNSEAYSAKGIDSTPTLLINGTKVEGATWAELDAALKAAGVS